MRKLILILLPLALFAQDPDDVREQQRNTPTVDAGKNLFGQTCGFCHGRDARGASAPDLIRSTLVNHDVNGNLIGPVIRNGRPDKGMPAFQLSDAQIHNIAEFLHGETGNAASVARKVPTEYPLQKLLVGKASDGQVYFAAHCASCHSPSGDLAHIATKYKPFDLQTRIAFPAGAKPTVTARDAEGTVFQGEQVYADEFLVSLRDKDRKVHTFARKSASIQIHDPLAQHETLLRTYTDKNVHDLFAYLETLK